MGRHSVLMGRSGYTQPSGQTVFFLSRAHLVSYVFLYCFRMVAHHLSKYIVRKGGSKGKWARWISCVFCFGEIFNAVAKPTSKTGTTHMIFARIFPFAVSHFEKQRFFCASSSNAYSNQFSGMKKKNEMIMKIRCWFIASTRTLDKSLSNQFCFWFFIFCVIKSIESTVVKMSRAILLTVSAVRLHVIVCRMHACMFYYDSPDCKYAGAAAAVFVVAFRCSRPLNSD